MNQDKMLDQLKTVGAYKKDESEKLVDGMVRAYDLGLAKKHDQWLLAVDEKLERIEDVFQTCEIGHDEGLKLKGEREGLKELKALMKNT